MASVKEKYSFAKIDAIHQDLWNERSEWEAEWRQISDFLLPGRGIYQTYTKPRKRKLTTPNVINTIGEDSLYVLTSGLHGRLTSPAMPWFKIEWADDDLKQVEYLVAWLQECEKLLHTGLHASNFYSIIHSFYIEYAGFGTGCIYVGEDTDDDSIPFRFELLTAGEFSFSLSATGMVDVFMRTIFMSPRQLVERFPKTASDDLKQRVKDNEAGIDVVELAVLEFITKDVYQDKDYVRIYYEVTTSGKRNRRRDQDPLEISGFYEMPYPVARWNTIGSDVYGIGPGSRSLPDIKRLQEKEKAFLMATHKTINPPLNAPARMRGKLNTLPGGYNYYANPNETVNQVYQVNFDFQGVSAAIERVEQRIQRNFFNDVFLTAVRDPNASPLKATQVNAQQQEQIFRLGPIVERLQFEMFKPVVNRGFNIMHRKGLFPPMDPQFEEMIGDFDITLISPLAVQQRAIKSQGTDAFMGFLGQAAQFDQTILDNINPDIAARQRAEIEGVDLGVLRPVEEVEQIRADRAAALKAKQDQEQQLALAQMQLQGGQAQADTRKTTAETGQILAETQETAVGAGLQ